MDPTISALMERPKAVTECCRHSLGRALFPSAPLAEIVDLKFFCWFSFVESRPCGTRQNEQFNVTGEGRQHIYLHRQIRIDLSL